MMSFSAFVRSLGLFYYVYIYINPEVLRSVQPWNSKSPTWRFVQPVACYPPPPRITKWQCSTWGSFLLPKMRSSLRQCGALAWKKWRDGWWTSVVEDFKKGGDKTIYKFAVAKNPWLIEGYNHTEDLSVKLLFFSLSYPQKLTAGTPKWRWMEDEIPFQRVHVRGCKFSKRI